MWPRKRVENLSLHDLLARSEVLVLCASANEGSRALIGREEIALLAPDAILVNVARAALLDTDALVERLRRGDLYAALGCLRPRASGTRLAAAHSAQRLLTPHRAGGIDESNRRILSALIDD
jgi:phosphoglycerate dehydrogenase-like enzyme